MTEKVAADLKKLVAEKDKIDMRTIINLNREK